MEISCQNDGNTAIVALNGSVDNDEAKELGQLLHTLLSQGHDEIVFKLSGVLFMSSLAIGLFLIFYKELIANGRRLRIRGISDPVFKVFHSIKLDKLIPVEK